MKCTLALIVLLIFGGDLLAQQRYPQPDTSYTRLGAVDLHLRPSYYQVSHVTPADKAVLWLAFATAGMMPALLNHFGGDYDTLQGQAWALGGMALSAGSAALSITYYIRSSRAR